MGWVGPDERVGGFEITFSFSLGLMSASEKERGEGDVRPGR